MWIQQGKTIKELRSTSGTSWKKIGRTVGDGKLLNSPFTGGKQESFAAGRPYQRDVTRAASNRGLCPSMKNPRLCRGIFIVPGGGWLLTRERTQRNGRFLFGTLSPPRYLPFPGFPPLPHPGVISLGGKPTPLRRPPPFRDQPSRGKGPAGTKAPPQNTASPENAFPFPRFLPSPAPGCFPLGNAHPTGTPPTFPGPTLPGKGPAGTKAPPRNTASPPE